MEQTADLSRKQKILLVDLPTYPKGPVSLSLPAVASVFLPHFNVSVFDLNISDSPELFQSLKLEKNIAFLGMKVSAQNYKHAIELTRQIRSLNSELPVVWGGELPTLLPADCLKYATTIVQSLFETVAGEFITDLNCKALKPVYAGNNQSEITSLPVPALGLIDQAKYYSFMGLPLETSRGCTEVCTFCMVHQMQKNNYHFKSVEQLQSETEFYRGKFVNVIDYNFGVNAQHAIDTANILKQAGATGWMAEMCIEQLDNDELLAALGNSGCRMIYCGLETIEPTALKGIHKMNTNHVENYERIIRKAQSYGIQIASGFILGINEMNEKTFENTFDFFQRMGIIYAKLTFLTYNPGTKVAANMKKKGSFLTDDITWYDGNHLSYLPNGVQSDVVVKGADNFIRSFYSLRSIISRSFNTQLPFARRIEFILFNYLYRESYLQWIEHDVLNKPDNFEELLDKKFEKGWRIRLADKLISLVRRM